MVAPNVKAETMRLMDQRKALETEMDAIIAALSAPGGPGIAGGLVDAEGFPRADIDIPAVITQRRKLGELRNDHKDITNKIEKNLEALHSTKLSRSEQPIPRSSGTPAPLDGGLSQNDPMEEDSVTRLPFAMIDEIADGSPAAVDGLLLGDEIVKFGSVEAGDRLQERLVSEALSNENNQVSLLIIRQGSPMNLTITPRKWHGRGLMGCPPCAAPPMPSSTTRWRRRATNPGGSSRVGPRRPVSAPVGADLQLKALPSERWDDFAASWSVWAMRLPDDAAFIRLHRGLRHQRPG